jgi:hypothetical protein
MPQGRFIAAVVLAVAGAVNAGSVSPYPAAASCALPPALRTILGTNPVIFVGTVIATRDHRTTAVVRVDEVWRGRHVPRRVLVESGLNSESRYFRKGRRYLFVPEAISLVPPYQDDDCTATRPYTPALNRYRPRGAHRP